MIEKGIRVLLMGLALLAAPDMALAQDGGISRKKQEKTLQKKARQDKKQKVKQEKRDRKRHLSLQDKATRKRLKKHGKRADRNGSNSHRDSFFQRIF